MTHIDLDELDIMDAVTASRMWGKADNYVRQIWQKYPARFPKGSIRKIGRDLIVTTEAMEALTGIKKEDL